MSQKTTDFIDQNGDEWIEYPILHPKFKDWIIIYLLNNIEITDGLLKGYKITRRDIDEKLLEELISMLDAEKIKDLFEKSPWYESCANDIDWVKRIEIQAIIQKYTTNAISSTINLPNDVKKEQVSEIYTQAWKQGLKGVTVYRDGCRTGVLVSNSDKKDEFSYHDAPKRPVDLPCEIFHTTAKGNRWTVVVGLYDRKPFEVFAIPYHSEEIGDDVKAGILHKHGKGKYNLIVDGEVLSKNITENMSDEEEALTRIISTALRHGSSIDFVVEQLNKSHGTVVSFNKAIARILSKYAKKILTLKETCPSCNSENYVREEGCKKCYDCGHSACG